MTQVKVKGSGTLFRSGFLEALTKTHPLLILTMYVPFCGYLLWYFHSNVMPSLIAMLGVFVLGVFSWTFFEYILHRFVFHYVDDSPLAQRFHYLVHGVHHEYPKDRQRLVMPPIPSIIIATGFFFFFRLFVGDFVYAFFSGFVTGYLCYAMIHYSTHAFRPPKNSLKFLWTYHSKHHFKYPDKAYGVSSPLWDYVFGTFPPRDKK